MDRGEGGTAALGGARTDELGREPQDEHERVREPQDEHGRGREDDDERGGEGRRPVVVVTGASAGVGRATSRLFAASGYDVACLARGRAGLLGVAEDVERRGGRALPIQVDVADSGAVHTAAREVEDALGPIDVWVNNAMTTVFGWAWDVGPDEVRRATEVTYLGQVHGALAALDHMMPRDRGTIISVGSALAFRAIPLQAAYCGAKFATRGFMDSLRTELIATGSNVHVVSVHLPAVNTPQFGWCRTRLSGHPHPVPPVHPPERAARAILRAAEAPRRRVLVGGWNRMIVQLDKVIPGVLDHFAARTAVQGQIVDDVARTREGNLDVPFDDDVDHGASGAFDDEARGLRSPAFLRALPSMAGELAGAFTDRAAEILAEYRGPRTTV